MTTKHVIHEVNNALSKVIHWFSVNNLLLNSTVFLGITIDSKLQWGPHIVGLANRLSSAAFPVKKNHTIN